MKRRRYIGVLALALTSWLVPAIAQTSRATEAEVEAVYLLNFGKFVTWPAPAQGDFHICVLGKDPFGEVLDNTVNGESLNSRKVTVVRIPGGRPAPVCEVMFVSSAEEGRLKADLLAIRGMSILTVSDIPHFAERGGMIGLVEDGGRIRFEVNLTNAQQARLTLRSDLLKVALKVIGSSAAEGNR